MEESLKRLLKNSYSPYSGFRVASICLMKDGKSFGGVNVENASYGAAICAERGAILSAIASGYKKGDFSKLYVMCDSTRVSSSCFMCRQVINEFLIEMPKLFSIVMMVIKKFIWLKTYVPILLEVKI